MSRVRAPSIAPFFLLLVCQMSSLQALILGLIQGFVEFLPISSSSHLSIAKALMGLPSSESMVVFDLCCHSGTLFAAAYFLRCDIRTLFYERRDKLLQITLALIPLVPAYILLKPLREAANHQLYLIGYTLLATSLLLFMGQSLRLKRQASIAWKRRAQDAICIGLLQSMALVPGISRSASTISCARVLGWNAQEAVRFSFLLAIPTILGGNCLSLLKLSLQHPSTHFACSSSLIGFGASFVAGLAVIGPAIRFLETGRLRPFAWYCLFLGTCLCIGSFFKSMQL